MAEEGGGLLDFGKARAVEKGTLEWWKMSQSYRPKRAKFVAYHGSVSKVECEYQQFFGFAATKVELGGGFALNLNIPELGSPSSAEWVWEVWQEKTMVITF